VDYNTGEKNSIRSSEAFCGTWSLLPEKSWHQFGAPAQKAQYQIRHKGEHIEITSEWTTFDGHKFGTTNHFVPDGQNYPYANSGIADTVSTLFTDEGTLDITSAKDGEVVLFARKVLSEDGRHMTVTQTGRTKQGTSFSNISVYKKMPE
jgi:hypothetical protein